MPMRVVAVVGKDSGIKPVIFKCATENCPANRIKGSDFCFNHDPRFQRKESKPLTLPSGVTNLDLDNFNHIKKLCEELIKLEFESIQYWKKCEVEARDGGDDNAMFDAQLSKAVERFFKSVHQYEDIRLKASHDDKTEIINKEVELAKRLAEKYLLERRKKDEFDKEIDVGKKLKLWDELTEIRNEIKSVSVEDDELPIDGKS